MKLVNITLVASLLLLAGDVSSNPGAITDPCSKGCRKNQRAVQCDDCHTWYHAKCIHMGMDEYINLCQLSAAWSFSKCLFPLFHEAHSGDISYNNITAQSQSHLQSTPRLKRGLRIAHLNINRLLNKLDGIRDLLSDYNLDILALSETWLTRDISDDEINISGYSVVCKDRSNPLKRSGGG